MDKASKNCSETITVWLLLIIPTALSHRCAEDERLLRLFHEQGQNPQIPQPTAPPPPPVPAPAQASNLVSPIRRPAPSPDVRDRRSSASPQPTFDISPVRRPAAIPDLRDRRVSLPPKQAFDDVATRRRGARAQQRRDAALAAGAAAAAGPTSTNNVTDVTGRMLEGLASDGNLDVNGHDHKTPRDHHHKKQGAVRRSHSKRNKERPARETAPATAVTDGDVAERERRSKSDPSDTLAKVVKRSQQEQDGGISSFLDMVKMPHWSPPWSLTAVNVQSEQQQQPQRQGGLAARAGGRTTRTSSTTPTQYRLGGASSSSNNNNKTSQTAAVGAAAARADPHYESPPPARSSPEKTQGWKMGGVSRQGRSSVTWEGEHGRGVGGDGSLQPRLCVLDARTAVAAMGNQLVGKGVEMGLG